MVLCVVERRVSDVDPAAHGQAEHAEVRVAVPHHTGVAVVVADHRRFEVGLRLIREAVHAAAATVAVCIEHTVNVDVCEVFVSRPPGSEAAKAV